jgi:hypothetical protein
MAGFAESASVYRTDAQEIRKKGDSLDRTTQRQSIRACRSHDSKHGRSERRFAMCRKRAAEVL